MTAEDFLARLNQVRTRGANRWLACCPAHEDREPSLSISEGERGLLLHCFSGCALADICRSIGLAERDLFYAQEAAPRARREAARQRAHERRQREVLARKRSRRLDACKHAERFLESRRGLDISQWSDNHLNRELSRIADAYAILEKDPYA